jgi:RNA polymerase sigma-70 factor (ECF subfamily)
MSDDVALVLAAQSGDPSGLGTLLERHRALLYAVAAGMLGAGPQAEDAVHDSFLIALRRIGELRDPAAVRAWLLAILGNVCRAQLRRPATDPVAEVPEPPPERPVDEAIDRLALRDWVWTALDRLSPALRLPVVLRYFTAASAYEEIAELCGVPVGTVRSRLNAARRVLAHRLADEAAPMTAEREAASLAHLRAWGEAWTRFGRAGDLTPLADVMAPDVAFALLDGVPRRGVGQLGALLLADISDGVRPVFRGALPGEDISLVELELVNPVDDPDHCPPLLTQVLVHPRGTVERLVFRYESPSS